MANILKKVFENISYVKKENGGVSSAKNLDLSLVDTEYVSFISPKDKKALLSYKLPSLLTYRLLAGINQGYDKGKIKESVANLISLGFKNTP